MPKPQGMSGMGGSGFDMSNMNMNQMMMQPNLNGMFGGDGNMI